jgi:ribosomal protein S18 acetylase RimI-like enzyme
MKSTEDSKIAPATIDDLPRISALAGVIWRESYPDIICADQIDYMLSRMYDVDVMRREIADEGIHYDLLVISSPEDGEEEVAGFVSYGPGAAPGEMKIHKLYLLKAYQGRGLGSTMLKHTIDRARNAGYASVILNVNKYNERALATYRRHGFTTREAVVVDIGGGYVMDDYVMQLPIDHKSQEQ